MKRWLWALSGLALLSAGCGAEFDPPSEVTTLRVLGVQKSVPYAAPGETVELSMLWHDGAPRGSRDVEIMWLGGCFNPAGDLYFGCFDVFAGAGMPVAGSGERFSFTVPEDIISSRPDPTDPRLRKFGSAFVFFAVCAGHLEPRLGAGFPLACLDDQGRQLGADDFIAGYSTVYVYDELRNENPEIDGFRVNELSVVPDCIGQACVGDTSTPPAECGPGVVCIPRCTEEEELDCPEVPIRPELSPAIVELDEATGQGEEFQEQMWINYYVDRGSVKSGVRLLNDATTGFNDDYGTDLFAPPEPGPLRIWAVVHDNRGGVNWVRKTIWIE